jgi:cytoskeletal protein RodZ
MTPNTKRGDVAVWIALIIAIIALILAWVAYNRTGVDLEQQIQDQVEESINDAQNNIDQLGNDENDEEIPDTTTDTDETPATTTDTTAQ